MSITGCTFQLQTVRRDTEPYKREILGLEKTVVGLDHTRSNIFCQNEDGEWKSMDAFTVIITSDSKCDLNIVIFFLFGVNLSQICCEF